MESINKDKMNLIVYDDLMINCSNDKNIMNLFTQGSHDRNILVFLFSQNLFF